VKTLSQHNLQKIKVVNQPVSGCKPASRISYLSFGTRSIQVRNTVQELVRQGLEIGLFEFVPLIESPLVIRFCDFAFYLFCEIPETSPIC
jgi:hypothetical protein